MNPQLLTPEQLKAKQDKIKALGFALSSKNPLSVVAPNGELIDFSAVDEDYYSFYLACQFYLQGIKEGEENLMLKIRFAIKD